MDGFEYGTPEEAYDRLTGYAFARRYVAGKRVASVCLTSDYGTRLLARTADSVVGITGSPEVAERAKALYPAANADYESAGLPKLSQPDASFDVVAALQVIEHLDSPEELISETKRILKPGGLLLVSTPDKQSRSNERNLSPHPSEMYVREFRELLGRHFGHVSLRRQGSVAGGLVSGASEALAETPPESVRLSSTDPLPGSEPPPLGLVLAVCSDAELQEDAGPYLLLDRDRRVFEEDEDHREDVEILQKEVRRMQETEVQSFQNTIALRTSEVEYLRSELGLPEEQRAREAGQSWEGAQDLRTQNDALKRENDKIKTRLHEVEGSNIWRLSSPYRRGRSLLDSWLKGRSREQG